MTVRQLPVARAWASETWARPWSRSSSRASTSVPMTWKAKSLSIRVRTPSPAGLEQLAQPNILSSTCSAARANRSRWNARSTIVATHQPVIGSLRSSNRPLATGRQSAIASGAPIADAKARAKIGAARSTDAVVGGPAGSPRSRAIDVEGDAGHAARVDELEVREVDRHVERDAVIADATLDAQAQCPDLAGRGPVRVAPAAGMAVAPPGDDVVGGAGRDERRLERTHERAHQQAALVQPDDRIGHELTGAVVRDLPAALGPLDRDAASGEFIVAREDVGRVGVAAQGQDGRMLQEQELVPDRAGHALVDEPLLEGVRGSS